jgi:hypothetical protein
MRTMILGYGYFQSIDPSLGDEQKIIHTRSDLPSLLAP